MRYFKVKVGFGKDEFISIDETELALALKASGTGKMAIFREGAVAGNNIISILPDWNREMGWNRDHQLTGEDYICIGDNKQNEYRNYLEDVLNEVKGLPANNVGLLK